MSNKPRIKPFVGCTICGLPITIGDKVRITCVGFRDEDRDRPILNVQHENCLDQEAKSLGAEIDAQWNVG